MTLTPDDVAFWREVVTLLESTGAKVEKVNVQDRTVTVRIPEQRELR